MIANTCCLTRDVHVLVVACACDVLDLICIMAVPTHENVHSILPTGSYS